MKVVEMPLPESTGENIFQCAMRGYTLNQEWNHGMQFIQYEWKEKIFLCDSYERYWHGYAIFLRPLLTFFHTRTLYFGIWRFNCF